MADKELTDKEIIEERKANKDTFEAIDLVVFGKNDTFRKDYKFEELKLAIHLSVKYPNLLQQASIDATVSELFRGTEQSFYTNRIYQTLVTINELGKNTKVFLTDKDGSETEEVEDYFALDGHARPDILNAIADDLLVWMSRFRG